MTVRTSDPLYELRRLRREMLEAERQLAEPPPAFRRDLALLRLDLTQARVADLTARLCGWTRRDLPLEKAVTP
ncbi:hypothetical protein V1279_007134 [Bradyrhizobium sp. AZCC 1610]|uniref:hypothetical protein n=1 Tax=Bradyrhizobium sp. AZCC 1610 TaxID=3117020 RepID=UPI002FEF0344